MPKLVFKPSIQVGGGNLVQLTLPDFLNHCSASKRSAKQQTVYAALTLKCITKFQTSMSASWDPLNHDSLDSKHYIIKSESKYRTKNLEQIDLSSCTSTTLALLPLDLLHVEL